MLSDRLTHELTHLHRLTNCTLRGSSGAMILIALRRLHAFILCLTVVICVAAPEENIPKYWLTHAVNGAGEQEAGAVPGAGAGSDGNKKDVLRICGIFHNEGRYLEEWLTHHLVLGAQKIFL